MRLSLSKHPASWPSRRFRSAKRPKSVKCRTCSFSSLRTPQLLMRAEVGAAVSHRGRNRQNEQMRGRTAKCMLAFTKWACMIWDISLLLQLIIKDIIAERRFKTLNCCKYEQISKHSDDYMMESLQLTAHLR